MKSKTNIFSILSILAAGTLWGSMGLFVRTLGAHGLTPMQIVEIRSVVTVLLTVAGTALIAPKQLRVRVRDLWCFACNGICSVLFFNFCYFRSMDYLPLSIAAVLLYTAPVFVMLLSALFFKEKITKQKTAAIFFAVIGCVLVSGIWNIGSASLWSPMGLLLGLGAGFGYALYSIFSRFALNRGYTPLTVTVYTFLFAAAGGSLFTDFSAVQAAANDATSLWFWVLYATVTTVLPYLLYTYGLCRAENSVASVMASVEPVTATLFGMIVFAEIPSVTSVVGMTLVLLAIGMLGVGSSKEKKQ